MVKLIRNNQKKFLAALTILSMITFLVNRGANGDHSANDRQIGTIHGKPLLASEVTESHAELSALMHYVSFPDQDRDPQSQLMHSLIMAMESKPDLFMLLRHEANIDGTQVPADEVDAIMGAYTHETDPDSDSYMATRAGLTDLLKIIARFDQVASAVKVSNPQVNLTLAERGQTLQLNLIQLKADDYLDKIPAPTTQQLQDQFSRYADVLPHQPTPTTNPFGFGYRLAQRVRMQYIRLSPDAVGTAVVATKSSYDWEVQALKYYHAHSDEFIAKPTTSTAATTQPTGSQPFAVVHQKILIDLRQPLVVSLKDDVQRFINTTLSSDWQAYSQYLKLAKSGDEPDSSLGVRYSSFSYLTKMIDKVHAKFNVQLIASETPSDLSQDQIANIPGVGSSDLVQFVSLQSSAYLKLVATKDPVAPAQLLAPSPPLPGSDSNTTVFARLTEVLQSEPAPSLADVRPSVEADVRSFEAYNLAKDEAARAVAAVARQPLTVVALMSGRSIIHIDRMAMDESEIPDIIPALDDPATVSFKRQAFQLLATYDPVKNPTPAKTIELPPQGRVFAAQLAFVDAKWNQDNYFDARFEVANGLTRNDREMLMQEWFNPDAAIKRLEYKPEQKNSGS